MELAFDGVENSGEGSGGCDGGGEGLASKGGWRGALEEGEDIEGGGVLRGGGDEVVAVSAGSWCGVFVGAGSGAGYAGGSRGDGGGQGAAECADKTGVCEELVGFVMAEEVLVIGPYGVPL